VRNKKKPTCGGGVLHHWAVVLPHSPQLQRIGEQTGVVVVGAVVNEFPVDMLHGCGVRRQRVHIHGEHPGTSIGWLREHFEPLRVCRKGTRLAEGVCAGDAVVVQRPLVAGMGSAPGHEGATGPRVDVRRNAAHGND
jgi:hypothetical protein